MGSPSLLPNFEGLVERIRNESSLTAAIGDVKGGPLDEILGRMEDDHGVPVHARIAHHIGNPDSRPDETHEAVARLASAGQPRIVTTNYDEHLSSLLSPLYQNISRQQSRWVTTFQGLCTCMVPYLREKARLLLLTAILEGRT